MYMGSTLFFTEACVWIWDVECNSWLFCGFLI
jgi:hypothetical protein